MGDTHIDKLPDEILSEIFGYVCSRPIRLGIVHERDDPIWNLQLVCKRWRRVARSTPLLWCSFESNIWDFHYEALLTFQHFQLCMKLSGKAPLTISLKYGSFPNIMLNELINHADRWISFSVCVELLKSTMNKFNTSMINAIKQKGLGRLRKLAILGSELGDGGIVDKPFLDIFGHCANN
ncbi:hypothetical protein BDQ17DRAFT_458424 [Cyathus striatus]|nr:hypothetical protein BDQ17DRAFT_458424 [Cyathus striatus]